MDKLTQCAKIIQHIKDHGSITQREASRLGIYRLASRVFDLKKRGYDVRSARLEVINADGSKSHVAQYSIKEVNNEHGINHRTACG